MDISVEIYVIILLIFRVASMTLIFFVIKRQLDLFKLPIAKKIKHFRVVLFTLATIIFIGNIIPASIDIFTLLGDTNQPQTIHGISVLYSLSASLTALVSSYLIWKLYRLAADAKKMTDLTENQLTQERDNK